MTITRISEVNREYYAGLIPDEILNDEDLIILGMISDEGEACAALAVGINGSMAYIEWIYTAPEFREKGAATEMLDVILDLLEDTGLTGIETDYSAEEHELDDFLLEYGFLTGIEHDMYRVPTADIIYSAQTDALVSTDRMMQDIASVSRIDARLKEYLSRNGMDPESIGVFSNAYSFQRIGKDGEIAGCIMVSEEGEYDLKVMFLASDGELLTVESLITALYKVIIETGCTDGFISFTDHLDKAIDLVETLTGEVRDSYRIKGRRHAVMLFG